MIFRKLSLLFGFWFLVAAGTAWWIHTASFESLDLASIAPEAGLAELSIKPSDEPFSVPEVGSSLFDKIFSKTGASGVREYDVPYPFTRILQRLEQASGGVPARVVLFPMGRSLQRSAAVEGNHDIQNLDLFYRFPRLVVGFDRESVHPPGHLSLNVKGRIFIGMNEKAKILEIISYNDEAGRYEYQVVRDYEESRARQVVYANRQLCLSCHQNQTPIFARAPWSESNANPAMQEGLTRVLHANFGDGVDCATDPNAPFCSKETENGRGYFYQGAAVTVDQEVPYALDQEVRAANYFPAYHKMWQRLCAGVECRRDLLKQIFLYKLTGQKGLLQTPEVKAFNLRLRDNWIREFPLGMQIPESAIPDRDPLLNHKDRGLPDTGLVTGRPSEVKSGLEQVLANSDVPGEFEPLLPRPPSETWTSPFVNGTLSRLLVGYADFFTIGDARLLDELLVQSGPPADAYETLSSNCKFKRGSSAERPDYSLTCEPAADGKGLLFSTFIRIPPGGGELIGTSRTMRFFPPSSSCDPTRPTTPENLNEGSACPQIDNVVTRLRSNSGGGLQMYFQINSGLSVRMLDGRRLASATLPDLQPGETRQLALNFQVVRDAVVLLQVIDEASRVWSLFESAVEGPALNRQAVMTMVLGYFKRDASDFGNLTRAMPTLKKQSEAPEDELKELPLKPSERAVALAERNCAACHMNREGVPPAFLGSPGEPMPIEKKCQKVATCSPRMLYRLKMWECRESEFALKKTPMPPVARLQARNLDVPTWIQTERRRLIDSMRSIFPKAELLQELMKTGVSANEAQAFVEDLQTPGCPQFNSAWFEKLPLCGSRALMGADLCR